MPAKRSTWSTYSVRKQLLIALGSATVISLLVFGLISIIYTVVVGNVVVNTSYNTLLDEVNGIVGDAAASAALLFEATLNGTIGSVLTPITQISADVFRPDVPYGNATLFYLSPDGIAAAGSFVPPAGQRSGGDTITINHSTWLLANNIATTPPTLNPDQTSTVQLTQYVDEIFRTAYLSNPDIAGIYTGYQNGIFRRLPGTMKQTAFGPYDPTTRPWYKDSLQYMKYSNYTITDPYLDAGDKSWMITFTSPVLHPTTTTLLGVAGADMQIRTVESTLSSFSKDGLVLSLYLLTTGQALAHPQWDITTQNAFSYKNASNPSIPDTLWTTITQTPNSGHTTLTDPQTNTGYAVVWKSLTLTNGKIPEPFLTPTKSLPPSYIAIGTTPIADLQAPITALRKDTKAILARTTAITAGVFITFSTLVSLLVLYTAIITTRPLKNLTKESAKITQNIGTPDLFAGVCEGSTTTPTGGDASLYRRRLRAGGRGGSIEETAELETRFYEMIRTIREGSVRKRDGNENVFFADGRVPRVVEGFVMSVDLLPDVPPGYEAVGGSRGAGVGNVGAGGGQ